MCWCVRCYCEEEVLEQTKSGLILWLTAAGSIILTADRLLKMVFTYRGVGVAVEMRRNRKRRNSGVFAGVVRVGEAYEQNRGREMRVGEG